MGERLVCHMLSCKLKTQLKSYLIPIKNFDVLYTVQVQCVVN